MASMEESDALGVIVDAHEEVFEVAHTDTKLEPLQDVVGEQAHDDEALFVQPPKKSKRSDSLAGIVLLDSEEYDMELEEMDKQEQRGKLTRERLSDINLKLVSEEHIPIAVIPSIDHEFVGLVKEVTLEKSEKNKTRGMARKRPPLVNFDTAADVIRIARVDNKYFAEGYFSDTFPSELEGIIPETEYKQSIQNINEVIEGIPSLRIGFVWLPPTIIVLFVLLWLVIFFQNPPYIPLMVVFSIWSMCCIACVISFAAYFLFQREVHLAISKEDIRCFHRGIRFATQLTDRTALFIVIEQGEDRDE